MARALAFHQCGPGSIPAWCHMWVEFVVGSRHAPRVFLRVLQFSFLHKNQHFHIPILDRGPGRKPAKTGVTFSLNIAIV